MYRFLALSCSPYCHKYSRDNLERMVDAAVLLSDAMFPWPLFRINLLESGPVLFCKDHPVSEDHRTKTLKVITYSILLYRVFQETETLIKMLIPRELLNILKNGNHHILRHGVFFLLNKNTRM